MNPCVSQSSPPKVKNVGIFRKVFPKGSETFIVEPSKKMVGYRSTFITCNLLNAADEYSVVSVGKGARLSLKQSLYMLTRSPKLFSDQGKLAQLDLIHSHFGPDGIYAMDLARSLNIPFLVTFHGWDITVDRSVPWKVKSPLYYQLLWKESELKRSASKFIAVSKFIEAKLLEQGYPTEKVIQHYIGVDTERFAPSDSPTDSRYILCVGRHTEKKGIDTLLRAFARIAKKHPDVSLVQVGSGPLEQKLKRLSDRLNLGHRVNFLSACPHDQVQRLMQGAEMFALPSQTARNGDSEALGIVFLEASASGKPVVSTMHGGIPEVVMDGQTGFLVPEKDDKALAEKIDTLLSNRALGMEMGRNGREFVCTHFDIRQQTAKLETIYDSILNYDGMSI